MPSSQPTANLVGPAPTEYSIEACSTVMRVCACVSCPPWWLGTLQSCGRSQRCNAGSARRCFNRGAVCGHPGFAGCCRTAPRGLRLGTLLLASTSFSMGSTRCRMSHQNTLPVPQHRAQGAQADALQLHRQAHYCRLLPGPHQPCSPSEDTVIASMPVFVCCQAKSKTGSLHDHRHAHGTVFRCSTPSGSHDNRLWCAPPDHQHRRSLTWLPVAVFNDADICWGSALAQVEDRKLPVVLPRPHQVDIPLIMADAPADVGITTAHTAGF